MTDERRLGPPRTDVLLKVSYDEPRDLLADYLTDLGHGGMFLRTTTPFELGETVRFSVSFPGLVQPISLIGVVRWRRQPCDPSDDHEGVGVEFVFRDQLHREEIDGLLIKSAEPMEPAVSTSTFRVLLVEDNQFAQELFRHAVKRFHRELDLPNALEIATAASGQDALRHLEDHDVDLAIVDYFLPVVNGGDLIREMRQDARFQRTPVLVISVGGDGVREDALAAGADLYIDKPILLKQLLNTLRILLASRADAGGEA